MGGLREIKRPAPRGSSIEWALELSCARCEATFAHRPVHSGADDDRENEVMTAARRAGWDTLKGPRKSLCPACGARAAAAKVRARQEAKTMVVTKKPAAVAAPEGAKAEAPPQLDVTAALIIQRKLGEVYLDGVRGYGEGWSDKRVGEALGVPRAHVREVRRLVYGQDAAGDGEDVREVLAEVRGAIERLGALDRRASDIEELIGKHLEAAKGVQGLYDSLRSDLTKARADLDHITRRAAEIAKAVS